MMLVQLGNVVAGFALSGSVLGNIGGLKEPVAKMESALAPYKHGLGVIMFVLGILSLLQRMSLASVAFATGGYPQALLAIAMGILLGGPSLNMIPGVRNLRDVLHPYSSLIGVAGMAVGLYAII